MPDVIMVTVVFGINNNSSSYKPKEGGKWPAVRGGDGTVSRNPLTYIR